MDFLEVIEQAREVLRSKGRVTYRTLKVQFQLDEELLETLKEELIEAEHAPIEALPGIGRVLPSPIVVEILVEVCVGSGRLRTV